MSEQLSPSEGEQRQPSYSIRYVTEDDPEFESAIPIQLRGDESEAEIRSRIEADLPYYLWWTAPHWQEQGKPSELVKLDFASGRSVEIFNWLGFLNQEQIEEAKTVISEFANLGHGKALETTRYVLISDRLSEEAVLATGEKVNGAGTILPFDSPLNGIEIYAPALSGGHRTGGVSNFQGTLRHEMTHRLISGGDLVREWEEQFSRGSRVSKYAETSDKEDICDSMAALLSGSENLDPAKTQFLKERFMDDRAEDHIIDTSIQQGEAAQLPVLQTVYYRKGPEIIFHTEEENETK